jgi:hypothetical protein
VQQAPQRAEVVRGAAALADAEVRPQRARGFDETLVPRGLAEQDEPFGELGERSQVRSLQRRLAGAIRCRSDGPLKKGAQARRRRQRLGVAGGLRVLEQAHQDPAVGPKV